jgi:hypothetical protein
MENNFMASIARMLIKLNTKTYAKVRVTRTLASIKQSFDILRQIEIKTNFLHTLKVTFGAFGKPYF